MSNAELLYAAAVCFIGLPAMLKNWTAAALVISYLFMQGSYYGLGLIYPIPVSVLTDFTVIAVIYAKHPCFDLYPYANSKALVVAWSWSERSLWDRVILTLFPAGWLCYAFLAQPWWPLYFISLAQLLAAGFEAFEYFSTRTAKRAPAPEPSGLEFTVGWRDWNYG